MSLHPGYVSAEWCISAESSPINWEHCILVESPPVNFTYLGEPPLINFVQLPILEKFSHPYNLGGTSTNSGKTLAKCVVDVLTRLQLPLSMLRDQTYNGASNIAGIYSGCQAVVLHRQPLALYVHCGAHCCNLVAQKACAAVNIVCDAVSCVQDLGAVFSASIKCRAAFAKKYC